MYGFELRHAMESVSLSGRGITRLEPGQLVTLIHSSPHDVATPETTDTSLVYHQALTYPQVGMCLRHLDLSHNALESLAGLEGLPQLRILDLSHNRLTALSGATVFSGGLPLNLTHINLSHNQLVSLGNVSVLSAVNSTSRSYGGPLQALQHLQVVDVSHNRLGQLKGLPADSLLELEAGYNALRQLDGVEQCRQLVVLCVSHNLLREPEDVAALKALSQLRVLSMEGNPVLIRKRKLRSLFYLLPESLTQTDLPAFNTCSASANGAPDGDLTTPRAFLPATSALFVHGSGDTREPPPLAQIANIKDVPTSAPCEAAMRALRWQLEETRSERTRLAERVEHLEQMLRVHADCDDRWAAAHVGRAAPEPAAPPTVLSIIDTSDEVALGEADIVNAGADSSLARTEVSLRHPYDVRNDATECARVAAVWGGQERHETPDGAQRQPVTVHAEVSPSVSTSDLVCGRVERRNAAAGVMSKLRQVMPGQGMAE